MVGASGDGLVSGSGAGWDALLEEARCLVCVGPGGVGKTSCSAALALEAGRRGRRVVVLTIDPARRLANALGLPEIGTVETDIGPEAFAAAGLEPPPGRVSAAMLDIKEAWDDVVTRYHPDPERRRQLMDNRLYHALSTALAGSQEYMAMEKLHRLAHREEDRPDLIVLDTPPAGHALDFLEAPSRMIDALDNDATRWLLESGVGPRRFSRRMLDAGGGLLVRTIARFTGVELLQELAELLAAFSVMFDGFRTRARAVKTLLARDDTRFLVVGHPGELGLPEARAFVDRLAERDLSVGAVVLNRGTPDPFAAGAGDPEALASALAAAGAPGDLAPRLVAATARMAAQAEAEAEARARLAAEVDRPVALVPELPQDVHDLVGLDQLRAALVD